jgi:murein L,D-transpeptidase YcbB/YkuD
MAFATKKTADDNEPVSLEAQIDEAKATVARLDALKNELATEEAALFKNGHMQPESDTQSVTKRAAQQLLDGAADVVMRPNDTQRMLALGERLAAVRLACNIALKRLGKLMETREEEIEAQFLPVWYQHLEKNASLIEALRELARERHEMIESWARRTGIRPSPPAHADLNRLIGFVFIEEPLRMDPDGHAGRVLDAAKRAGLR